MRTTVTIDDSLLQAAKQRALEQRTTLRQVVEDALRAALLGPRDDAEVPPFRLVTFRGDGAREGIDLDRSSELLVAEDVARYGTGSR